MVQSDSEMNFQNLTTKPRWSPRVAFPPSTQVGKRLFACGDGFYLRVNPNKGHGDPVYAVGWAESNYWARRCWEVPPFAGSLIPDSPQWAPVPSLKFLGRPTDLAFGKVRQFESAQTGAKTVTLVVAKYRLTDGAFLYLTVNGTGGVTYLYSSNEPGAVDQPIALEFRLPEQ
jgi:hypothetical protein